MQRTRRGEGIRGSKEYKAELVGLRTRAMTDLHLARATQLPAGRVQDSNAVKSMDIDLLKHHELEKN